MLIASPSCGACPSDLQFDRWHLGELESSKRALIEDHCGTCALCAARRELRRGGFDALRVDADRLFDRIAAQKPRGFRGWVEDLRSAMDWRAPLVAAAALATVVALVPTDPIIRTKGGASLRVFRERAGVVEETTTGDRFAANDRIRFEVSVAPGSQIMVVGVEASGDVFTYYPADNDRSAAVRRRPDGALAGAIELDDYVGREWLHLVRCDREFARDELEPQPGRDGVKAPRNCDAFAFEMDRGDE